MISRGGSLAVEGVMGNDGGGKETQMPAEVGVGAEGRLSFSGADAQQRQGGSDVNVLAETFQSLATDDTFRRGPAVADKDLNAIMQTMASKVKEPENVLVEPNVPMNEDIARSYTVKINQGGDVVVNVMTDGTVWVDTQGNRAGQVAKKVQGGDLIYQAVQTYAHNNGLVFIPDGRDVTPIAQRRRISHMISSMLRHRTSRHLQPYDAKDRNNKFLPARSEWREEKSEVDFRHNLDLLLRAEMNYVASEMQARGKSLEDLRYDPDTDTVWQKQGGTDGGPSHWRQLSEDDYAALVTGLDPGRSGVGETTLARALLAKVRLEGLELGSRPSKSFGAYPPHRGGEATSQSESPLFRLRGTDQSPNILFYSLGEATGSERVKRTGVTRAETTAAEARLKNTAQGRAIYGNVLVVDNHAALDGLQGRPEQQRYHAEDWDIMQDAEGFHDPRDGTVVIFRDNVRVLEGETAAQALARVVVHERVGHHGFDALRESDSKFAEEWKKLAAAIPAEQMQELEGRYTHLTGNREALALEWFAHQVGNMEGRAQLEPGSVMQRMWQAMRDWVVRAFNPLGAPSQEMTQEVLDAHVRGLIRATRRGMVKGTKGKDTDVTAMTTSRTLLNGASSFGTNGRFQEGQGATAKISEENRLAFGLPLQSPIKDGPQPPLVAMHAIAPESRQQSPQGDSSHLNNPRSCLRTSNES
ncbi:hypothetical protein [Roseimicrobium sp. ORNL1]|uniref:hypothetical protein n=1 Tax=Roseimicrobium sp. ORNL1 TaxID=2711231 RepID=UPI0013E1A4C1|nr:hypothetical protein [Roseimicrobium sp. ORNL1]QIF01914.1 hypothetical protein G5S37_10365 [Roseimicrobium sp. ORNL1]